MQICRPPIFVCLFTLLTSLAGACGRSPLDIQPEKRPSPDAQQSDARGDAQAKPSPQDALPDLARAPDLAPDLSRDTVAKEAAPLPDVAMRSDLPTEGKRDVWSADIAIDVFRDTNTSDGRDAGSRSTDSALADSRSGDTGRPDAWVGVGPAKLSSFPGGFMVDRIAGTKSIRVAVKISNTGGQPSGPLTVAISGDNADMFAILDDGCSGVRLAPADTCEIGVIYTSTSMVRVRDDAILTVSDSDPGGSSAKCMMDGNTVVR